jgi:Cys-rich protein (TIGR01571 family)
MSYCFRPITEAQLLTRMNLNWCGSYTDNPASTLCVVVAVTVILFILYLIGVTGTVKWGVIPLAILVIYRLVYTCRMRRAYRKKYNVPASCCGDGVEDCCVVYWCGCCSAIQLARHTHDENKYPYRCCSKTGLAEYAPAIV